MVDTKNNILVINCGSSSLKFALIEPISGDETVSGLAERLLTDKAQLIWKKTGQKNKISLNDNYGNDHDAAIKCLIETLKAEGVLVEAPSAISHRVVHGGERFSGSVKIDETVISQIEENNLLAPLHNPANIIGIRATQKYFPDIPQIAVFDTAFHQTMPAHVFNYALPYELYKEHGIRRYGFHGTSHHYVTEKASRLLNIPYDNSAFISAHLGNGCSTCAVLNGQSVDTSMGMTPLEGLVMGTRSGDIDPSIYQFLSENLSYSVSDITDLLNKKSGLLGVSGVSNDMRELLEAVNKGDDRARLAVDVFCYRLAKNIASLVVPLGRLDALIFTGGIGENADAIRERVIGQLSLLGFELDVKANINNGQNNNGSITTKSSTLAMVVQTNEELMIAREAQKFL